jgi:hypothetical protein
VRNSGFKVVLTGEGADEVLAGYDIFKEAAIRRFWARRPDSALRPLLLRRLYGDIPGMAKTSTSLLAAFFRNESLTDQALEFDTTSASGLERYVADCVDADRTLRRRIDEVVDAKRPILVWGVGTHTSRLMATSRLADAEIVAFIESNARYHGKSLHGRPIVAPETLRERGEPVLISSRVFQNEIANQIRDELKCANELILLYDF